MLFLFGYSFMDEQKAEDKNKQNYHLLTPFRIVRLNSHVNMLTKIFYIDILVWALTSFQFNVFLKKRFDMLSQCLVQSLTKKVISYSLGLGQQPLIILQAKNY